MKETKEAWIEKEKMKDSRKDRNKRKKKNESI